jgi:hypothetical protein
MHRNGADLTVSTASIATALLAVIAPVMHVGQPIQLIAVLGGVLLGPGSLACRLMTKSRWAECLLIGVAANIATLMMISLGAVDLHLWHPGIELIIPVMTCLLGIALMRRADALDRQVK